MPKTGHVCWEHSFLSTTSIIDDGWKIYDFANLVFLFHFLSQNNRFTSSSCQFFLWIVLGGLTDLIFLRLMSADGKIASSVKGWETLVPIPNVVGISSPAKGQNQLVRSGGRQKKKLFRKTQGIFWTLDRCSKSLCITTRDPATDSNYITQKVHSPKSVIWGQLSKNLANNATSQSRHVVLELECLKILLVVVLVTLPTLTSMTTTFQSPGEWKVDVGEWLG